jgi:hypothetical protein
VATPITSALKREHAELLRLLRATMGAEGVVNLPCFDEFRHLAVLHIVIEEKLLLPALRRRLKSPPVFQNGLRKDHAAIVAHCLPMPDAEWLKDLDDLLAYHQGLEEAPGGLFSLYDQHVGHDPEVAKAMAALPRIELPPFQSGPSLGWRLRDILKEAGLES